MALETLTPTTHRMLDLDKPLYTISVAAEILSSHPRTLMMYESMGLGVPARTATNRRRYTQRDILTLDSDSAADATARPQHRRRALCHQCLQLLDAHGIPRPSELTDIDLEHVRI